MSGEVTHFFSISKETRKKFLNSPVGKKIDEEIPEEVKKEIIQILKERLSIWKCRNCGRRWLMSVLVCPVCKNGRTVEMEDFEFET